ncbi:Na-translocating system protein MpsC family protein [Cytobacillus sp. BC1816]|uniref:Na-translocating system protein MpsC family protein n=1 Tax=Cytobacillus sp. BC1816 TaxID=3440154 RepID=UPI003F514AD9
MNIRIIQINAFINLIKKVPNPLVYMVLGIFKIISYLTLRRINVYFVKGNLTNTEKFMIESSEGHQMVYEARTTLVKRIDEDSAEVKKLEN